MKAIILSGGKGTRLAGILDDIPKSMVEIDGRPLLLRHIEKLRDTGVKEICITVGHLAKVITNYFKDGSKFNVNITYSFENNLLGTGGALVPIKNFITDDTMIIYADVVDEIDYLKMKKFHSKNKAVITAAVHPTTHPKDSDFIVYDQLFNMKKIYRKPHKYIPEDPIGLAALFIVNPNIKQFLTLTTPFDFAHDLIPFVLKRSGNIFCYNTPELIMDIGTPERLKEARDILSK